MKINQYKSYSLEVERKDWKNNKQSFIDLWGSGLTFVFLESQKEKWERMGPKEGKKKIKEIKTGNISNLIKTTNS